MKINPWAEYDSAAWQLACQGKNGSLGDALPENLSPEALKLINEDIEAFQERVRLSAYAIASIRAENYVSNG
jgi:hypothetical protein